MNMGKMNLNFYYETLLDAIGRYESMGLENPFIMIDTNMIIQGNSIWSKFELFAKLFSTVPGMKRLRRQFELHDRVLLSRWAPKPARNLWMFHYRPMFGLGKHVALVEEIYSTLTK